MSNKQEQQHHFFASTAFGWIAENDLATCLARLRRTGGYSKTAKGLPYVVFRVPLPQTANYQINNYQPQVEGVELLAEGKFE